MSPGPTTPHGVGAGGRSRSRLVHRVLAAAAAHGSTVEKEILGLPELVGPGATCLDVGAEFGLYTHVLADLVGPEGAVHAYEPQRAVHRLLLAGVRAAGSGWVGVHRRALAARSGRADLSVPRRRGLAVPGRAFVTTGALDDGPNREFGAKRLEAVTVGTLDEEVDRLGLAPPTLVKADVEGAEGALLDGARDTLRMHRPLLLLEIEDRHTAKFGVRATAIVDRLQTDGYTPHVFVAEGTGGRWRAVDTLVAGERNYLFRP